MQLAVFERRLVVVYCVRVQLKLLGDLYYYRRTQPRHPEDDLRHIDQYRGRIKDSQHHVEKPGRRTQQKRGHHARLRRSLVIRGRVLVQLFVPPGQHHPRI